LSREFTRLFATRGNVVVVAMGRGGPAELELVAHPPSLGDLLELSRSGRHAASDHLEDAVLTGVPTVGTFRCGGGLAGAPFVSNIERGAELAASLNPDLVLFEGSGSALPRVATRRRVLVGRACQPPDRVTGYLGLYRVLVSDFVVLTMAGPNTLHEELLTAIRQVKDIPIIATILRPRPTQDISQGRVALFTTAPSRALPGMVEHLRHAYDADMVAASGNLARRDELHVDLDRVEADLYLVEIKAAAIDMVAEHAHQRGIPVVFCDNEVTALPGEDDLDKALLTVADETLGLASHGLLRSPRSPPRTIPGPSSGTIPATASTPPARPGPAA
jgi:cyclic 2,3-diphosphoglycerate synthase